MNSIDLEATITQYILGLIDDSIIYSTGGKTLHQYLSKDAFSAAYKRIEREASNAAKAFEKTFTYEIILPYLGMVEGEPINFEYELKRSEIEKISRSS